MVSLTSSSPSATAQPACVVVSTNALQKISSQTTPKPCANEFMSALHKDTTSSTAATEEAAADKTEVKLAAEAPAILLATPEGIILLGALPFSNICGFLWTYTALPLHFVDSGWPLWQLATLLTLCYIPRLCTTAAYSHFGDWLCVPNAVLACALNINMACHPNSLAAVVLAVSAMCAAQSPTAYRSLIYARFHESGTWQLQRAMRIFTLCDTVGYASAPFIGGILYDNGGMRSCAIFASAMFLTCSVLPLTLGVLRLSFARTWKRRPPSAAAPGPTDTEIDGARSLAMVETDMGAPEVAGPEASPAGMAVHPSEPRAGAPFAPVAVIMLAVFSNICIYAVEWCLYALYFRTVYDWSGTGMGLAQMVGDLLAGAALGLSTMRAVVRTAQRVHLPRALRALGRAPFGVAFLFCCHAVLMVMLAQPHFLVALTGQVLLGSAYVFCEQFLQELLLLYSFGGHARYRRLVLCHYLCFTAGCALCAPAAYGLYEQMGTFASAFYATAAYAAVVGVVFGAYFACRLSQTTAGLFGRLVDVEDELNHCNTGR